MTHHALLIEFKENIWDSRDVFSPYLTEVIKGGEETRGRQQQHNMWMINGGNKACWKCINPLKSRCVSLWYSSQRRDMTNTENSPETPAQSWKTPQTFKSQFCLNVNEVIKLTWRSRCRSGNGGKLLLGLSSLKNNVLTSRFRCFLRCCRLQRLPPWASSGARTCEAFHLHRHQS